MYTLEDDQETSSRLNKRDIAAAAESQAGTFGDGGELEVSDIQDAQASSSLSKHFSAQQITSSFKKLMNYVARAFLGHWGVRIIESDMDKRNLLRS